MFEMFQEVPKVSSDLMYVDLPIRSEKECRKLLKDITDLPSGMMCAGYLEGGRDACQVTYSLSQFMYIYL